MKIRIIVFIVFGLFWSFMGFAQKEDEKTGISDKELIGEGLFTEGMKYYLAGNFDKAIPYFRTIIEKNKNNAGSHFMLSKTYLAQDNLENALNSAQNAYEINPQNPYYLKHFGLILIKLHKYKDATDIWKKSLKLEPKLVDNYLQLAELYLTQNKYSEAIEVYNDIEKLIGIDEDISRQKQQIYLQQNKVSEALKEGNKLISAEPANPEILLPQIQVMLGNNKIKEAQELLENSLTKDPNFGEAYLILAEIYYKKGDLEKSYKHLTAAINNSNISADLKLKALQSFKEISTIEDKEKVKEKELLTLSENFVNQYPDNPKALVFLATIYAQNQQDLKARDLYLKSLKFDKSIFEVWMAVIEIDSKLNLIKDLVEHSEKAIDYFPSQAYFWYHNGFAHMMLKNKTEAISSLEEARLMTNNNPELKIAIITLLGDLYNDNKNFKKSEDAYDEVLALNPLNEHVLNNYSYFLSLRKQNLPKAIELSKKLVLAFPNNPTYLDTFAWALFQSQKFTEAKSQLDKAFESNQKLTGTIVEHYGDILFKLDNKTEAVAQWKKAKELGGVSNLIDKKINDGQYYE